MPIYPHLFLSSNGFFLVIMLKRCGIVWVRRISNCLNFKWRNLTGRHTLLIITREYAFTYSMKMKVL